MKDFGKNTFYFLRIKEIIKEHFICFVSIRCFLETCPNNWHTTGWKFNNEIIQQAAANYI